MLFLNRAGARPHSYGVARRTLYIEAERVMYDAGLGGSVAVVKRRLAQAPRSPVEAP